MTDLRALPAIAHPTWCDPRTCEPDVSGLDHRELIADGWKPAEDNVAVTVAVARYDEICRWDGSRYVGPVQARLLLEHFGAGTHLPDGTVQPLACEAVLSAASARHLAGLLNAVADRLDGIGGVR